MKNVLLALSLVLSTVTLFAQQTPKGLTASNNQFIGFYEFKPANYNASSNAFPLIIFLHGIGERGNGTTELSRVLWNAIPRYINEGASMTFDYGGKQHSFLVLSPQLSSAYGLWQDFYVEEMIKYARQNLKVDTNRIYLCGLSLGGGGTWKYATSSSTAAKQLAAIAPVCGTGDGTNFSNIAQNKVAVWAFHAVDDGTVGVGSSYYAINTVNSYNPQIVPKTTFYATGGHGIWDIAFDMGHSLQNPNVYEWMLSFSRKADAPLNLAPVAIAGSDIEIMLPTSTINLKGTSSFDQDMTAIKYQWTQVSGGATATIATATAANTSISGLVAGTYVFRLTVTDIQGAVGTDDVTVLVHPAGSGNAKPVAIAGDDLTVTGDSYVCNAYGSNDPDGTIAGYLWSKISGPAQYNMQSPIYSVVNVNGLTNGTYEFRIQVTDNVGAISADTVKVVVSQPSINIPPVANAGIDITTNNTFAILNASASNDADGTLTYSWQQIGGAMPATITNTASARTGINNMEQGVYIFRLTVTDSKGAIDTDDIIVTIGSIVLPVEWLYVNAARKNGANWLLWATVNESNSAYFEVERSDDGVAYTTIGKVAAHENSSTNQQYSFADNNSLTGKAFYRLKQVDENGKASLSKVVILYSDGERTMEAIYPNPAQTNITVSIHNNSRGEGTITVFDFGGRVVVKKVINKTEDYFQSNINLSELTSGIYLVQTNVGNQYQLIQKVLKQ